MMIGGYLLLIAKSRLLYVLSINWMILTQTTAIKCFSNQFAHMLEENCGPAGFCFILRKDRSIRGSNFTLRGCDHTFLCEMISEEVGVKKTIYNNEIIRYCMDNVHYIKFSGYFCCCKNHDWCNKHSRAEEVSQERILENLIQGTPSNEKWRKLQKIAEEQEIRVAR